MSNALPKNTPRYQFLAMLDAMKATPQFIIDNKLWVSVREQKGILIFAIIISFLFTYLLYGDITEFSTNYFNNSGTEGPVSDAVNQSNILDKEDIHVPEINEMISSNTKFMLIVLMEVVIFSFSVKTLNILRDQSRELGIKDFWKAEVRMMVVMLLSFIAGTVLLVLTKTALNIIGISFLTSFVMFFIYAYILGFAFFDNFNEQFGLKIKHSRKIIWKHKGAALALGLAATVLLFIPLIGALIVPVCGGIASTIYAHQNNMELTPQ